MMRMNPILYYCLSSLCALWLNVLPAFSQQAGKEQSQEETKFVQQVIELTNRERVKAGLSPLKAQANLCMAAQWMAEDMAAKEYFDHKDQQGREITGRLKDFGYQDYRVLGENIAAGQHTPEQVVAGWMQSPGHRRNLLNPKFSEIGVGFVSAPDSLFHRYCVQDFGSRSGVAPVINSRNIASSQSH